MDNRVYIDKYISKMVIKRELCKDNCKVRKINGCFFRDYLNKSYNEMAEKKFLYIPKVN